MDHHQALAAGYWSLQQWYTVAWSQTGISLLFIGLSLMPVVPAYLTGLISGMNQQIYQT